MGALLFFFINSFSSKTFINSFLDKLLISLSLFFSTNFSTAYSYGFFLFPLTSLTSFLGSFFLLSSFL